MARALTDSERKIVSMGIDILKDAIGQHGEMMSDPEDVKDYLRLKMPLRERECFGLLLLDNQHRLIADVELFHGTVDGASVHPREVVKEVLQNNAAAVIMYHNHPSGVAEPSQSDRRITDRLKSALQLIDVRVLDHFIAGDLEIMSFQEHGLISEPKQHTYQAAGHGR